MNEYRKEGNKEERNGWLDGGGREGGREGGRVDKLITA